MRTTTVKESIKVIRQYVGKKVTVRNGGPAEMLRVIGYSVSTMAHSKLLTVIIEDSKGGWPVTKEMVDTKAGEKVYARFIGKGLTARFENLFAIDEFEHLTDVDYIK
ncbi:hypothetical protein PM708P2_00028 [Parabacteroides phage PM708P2]|nr:hypothetical protein PM708P2_00028 [Parabacteroides phage PM708P2]